MPRVFIPQIVQRVSQATGRLAPVYDFSDALRFGDIEYVLDVNDDPNYVAAMMSKIRRNMDQFSTGDFLLAVGDPTVIAACAGIAFRNTDAVNMLRWDRKLHRYQSLTVTI